MTTSRFRYRGAIPVVGSLLAAISLASVAACTKDPPPITAQDIAGAFALVKCGGDLYIAEKAATAQANTAANVANGATAAGNTLSQDAACQTAVSAGAAKIQQLSQPAGSSQ